MVVGLLRQRSPVVAVAVAVKFAAPAVVGRDVHQLQVSAEGCYQ